MSTQMLTTLDFNSVGKIINMPDGVAASDPVTVGQLAAVQAGINWKDDVAAAPAGNINIATPGTIVDGTYTVILNDRVLLMNQTTNTANGIHIFNGPSTAMTRSADADTSAELTEAVVTVANGVNGGSTFRQTAVDPTISSTPILWVSFGVVAPPASTSTPGIIAVATQSEVNAGTVTNKAVTPETLAASPLLLKKHNATIGDGSNTSYAITHNLGTRDVQVKIYRASGSYDEVIADVDMTDANTVTVVFNAAPASGAYRVVIIG